MASFVSKIRFAALVSGFALACASGPLPRIMSSPPPPLPDVLFAENTMMLGPFNSVSGGDIVVRQIQPLPPNGPTQLVIGDQSHVGDDGSCNATNNIVANSIVLGSGACTGNLQTSSLTNNGGTFGTQSAFPSAPLPAMTIAPPPVTGTAVTVNGFMALGPGTYGDVVVSTGAWLELSTGSYSFASLSIQDGNAVMFGDSGSVNVSVGGDFTTMPNAGVFAYMSNAPGDLNINVGGNIDIGMGSVGRIHPKSGGLRASTSSSAKRNSVVTFRLPLLRRRS
jgi:hypothetical protein